MTRTLHIALLAAGCSLAAAPALAAGEAGGVSETKVEEMQATESLQRAESQCGHVWTLVDTDEDLQVSTEEARAAADKVMDRADIDRSGDIGPDEWAECAARGAETAAVESASRNRSLDRFAEYDLDGDGTVSVEEMLTAAEGEFLGADTDEDRVLTAAELQEMARDERKTAISEAADISGDERISADEMAAHVRREFLTTDRDRDGGIDVEEWQAETGTPGAARAAGERAREAATDRFGQLDFDESGAITRDEIQQFTIEEWGAAARRAEEMDVDAPEKPAGDRGAGSGQAAEDGRMADDGDRAARAQQAARPAEGDDDLADDDLGNVWIFRIYRFQ
jgi:Ca2+-binding EF-hand superfamily protein